MVRRVRKASHSHSPQVTDGDEYGTGSRDEACGEGQPKDAQRSQGTLEQEPGGHRSHGLTWNGWPSFPKMRKRKGHVNMQRHGMTRDHKDPGGFEVRQSRV